MSNATMIYPYDWKSLPLVRNKGSIKGLDITQCVSPVGWGLDGIDAGHLDHGETLTLPITSDFQQALGRADTVLFAHHDRESALQHADLIEKIEQAIDEKKHIVCTVDLTQSEYEDLDRRCLQNKCNFTYFNTNLYQNSAMKQEMQGKKLLLKTITVPVIMVFGLTERVGSLDTQLALVNYLKSIGYKSSLISSRSDGSLFGVHSMPGFMLSHEFTSSEKIILFNHYLKNVEKTEDPDVLIVGVPGGLLPITNRETQNFGTLAYKITRAAQPDASLVCLASAHYTPEYFNRLTPLLTHRFSMDIVGYLAHNVVLDFLSGEDSLDDPRFTVVDHQMVADAIPKELADIVYTKQTREQLFEAVVEKLAYYGDVEAL
ncbi:TIGR04066 family peptide maturation system protein [Desulfovibrio inopinatus]|uniref:TIGR04066 family peptide maturation system protein n=1 Tax=Desulfovibrio inopinatus TaxID=102109 RepID=UPI0003F9D41F|nr:TIGR04066 family peptide maturation system protein [Desulfovibrio inopinatus]